MTDATAELRDTAIHDRASIFSEHLNTILQAAGVESVRLPARMDQFARESQKAERSQFCRRSVATFCALP
jgi:hypothetical protein